MPLTVPFKMAEVPVTALAATVVTLGGPAIITKVTSSVGAGAYVPSPDWVARIVQTPGLTMTIEFPSAETVQTSGVSETLVTVSPDEEVGLMTIGVLGKVCDPGFAKVMFCGLRPSIENVCVTG